MFEATVEAVKDREGAVGWLRSGRVGWRGRGGGFASNGVPGLEV